MNVKWPVLLLAVFLLLAFSRVQAEEEHELFLTPPVEEGGPARKHAEAHADAEDQRWSDVRKGFERRRKYLNLKDPE